MKMENITSLSDLQSGLKKHPDAFLLLYKEGSEQSDCAFSRVKNLEDKIDTLLFLANVNVVKDIHSEYNVQTAPSLLEFKEGKVRNMYKGCQAEAFYMAAMSGSGFSTIQGNDEKKAKRVTVYTTPTCTWCNTIKTYLDENGIRYTEVNVASDPAKADEMVRKSGQQGVPQTDINGQIVVGFDKNQINKLLEIQ
jgi:glutaredoxin-like YruB-family protein